MILKYPKYNRGGITYQELWSKPTWREKGISYNEIHNFNSLTEDDVIGILTALGYKVDEFNFDYLHKKEHFDYISEENIFYRNDINGSLPFSVKRIGLYEEGGMTYQELWENPKIELAERIASVRFEVEYNSYSKDEMDDDDLLYDMPFKYWKVGLFGNQDDIENTIKKLADIYSQKPMNELIEMAKDLGLEDLESYENGGKVDDILNLYKKETFSEKDNEKINKAIDKGYIDNEDIKNDFLDYAYNKIEKESNDLKYMFTKAPNYSDEEIWSYTDENYSNGLTHIENFNNLIDFLDENYKKGKYSKGGVVDKILIDVITLSEHKHKILVNGRLWNNPKKDYTDLGNKIINILFYVNRDGDKSIKIIVDGDDRTLEFKKDITNKYSNSGLKHFIGYLGKYQNGGLAYEDLWDIDIVKLAQSHPYSNKTETSSYPLKDKVPNYFLNELGVKLKKSNDYVLVLEIQFDTRKLILQGFEYLGNTFGNLPIISYDSDFFSLDIDKLPIMFKEWLAVEIKNDIYRIQNLGISRFSSGGEIEISKEQLENMVGRKLNGWNDDKIEYKGLLYQKCFLKPFYKKI